MIRLLASASTLALLAGAAFAADLPVYTPTVAPMMTPAYSWTGFYVGVNGGWGFAEGEVDHEYTGATFTAEFPDSSDVDPDGGLIGGTIGLNWQADALVFGLEGDIAWSDINGSDSFDGVIDPLGAATPFTTATDFDMEWFATLRGRIGFAADRVLLYATGGAAFADVSLDHEVVVGDPATATFDGSSDDTEIGWTAGGGVEFAVADNWTLKAEALYFDLGDVSVTSTDPLVAGESVESDLDLTGVVIRGGANLKF
jgi:outer membrane immunogenic protein